MITFRSCLVGSLTALLLLIAAVDAKAQIYRNGHPFDAKPFNLGFLMGFAYNSYNLKEQVNITDAGTTLKGITLISKPGINLGMIANLNLSQQISLRSVIGISLEQRDFEFRFDNGITEIRKIEAAYLNVPLMAQIKTGYYKSSRVYVLVGGEWAYNLSSDKKVLDDPRLLKIDKQDVSLVFGFGLNLYGERLKLSPEIVYKMGLFNLYEPDNTTHSAAISSLHSQVLSLNINFE
jgi:hypothetical protein